MKKSTFVIFDSKAIGVGRFAKSGAIYTIDSNTFNGTVIVKEVGNRHCTGRLAFRTELIEVTSVSARQARAKNERLTEMQRGLYKEIYTI